MLRYLNIYNNFWRPKCNEGINHVIYIWWSGTYNIITLDGLVCVSNLCMNVYPGNKNILLYNIDIKVAAKFLYTNLLAFRPRIAAVSRNLCGTVTSLIRYKRRYLLPKSYKFISNFRPKSINNIFTSTSELIAINCWMGNMK